MDLHRIGDKLVSKQKIMRRIERILELRSQGLSQQDVATELQVDRAFVSRLEGLGEVRKGRKLALIGFPVKNKAELERLAETHGIDFVLLMSNNERWGYLDQYKGADLFNEIMDIISRVRDYDLVIFLGSDRRIRLAEAVLGPDVIVGVELGRSPITEDCYVDPVVLENLIDSLKGS